MKSLTANNPAKYLSKDLFNLDKCNNPLWLDDRQNIVITV